MLLTLIAWVILIPSAARAGEPQPQPPQIAPLDQQFLTRVVRRTIEQSIRDDTVYQPQYTPPSLNRTECQFVVTFWQESLVRGAGTGPSGPAIIACRNAAMAALSDARSVGALAPNWTNRVRIEIEAVGPATRIRRSGNWTDLTSIKDKIEPGIDGLLAELGGNRKQFRPSEIISTCIAIPKALEKLGQQLATMPEELIAAKLYRFRTTHWHEPKPGEPVVQLHRGVALLPPSAVTHENLTSAIRQTAKYMIYRQKTTGWFSYEYEPSQDRYTDEDNLVRQAGSCWALASHARRDKARESATAARLTLQLLTDRMVNLAGVDQAAFVAGQKNLHKLGITAFTTLALLEYPDAEELAAKSNKLLNAMHWLQLPTGRFLTAFPPSDRLAGEYYYPGETLLAVATQHERQPTQRAIDTFNSAFAYYNRSFANDPKPAQAEWLSQAFARMAVRTRKPEHIAFVFEMVDWLIQGQLNAGNCAWPELFGGIRTAADPEPGITTAAYLEAIVDGLVLARLVEDRARAVRYENAVRLAARFVMQLQFKPEEAYYVQSMIDTVGGYRTTLTVNHLRIDHCQHALMALMKTRDALFGSAG